MSLNHCIFLQYGVYDLNSGLILKVQRLLVIEFLSLRSMEDSIIKRRCWSDEIYQGEFDDLSRCNLDCKETSQSTPLLQPNSQPDSDVLQVSTTNTI